MPLLTVSIITVFDELYDSFLRTSLVGRAQSDNLVSFNMLKLSDFCAPKERIDEPTCGPGAGMVLKPEVLQRAIEAAAKQHGPGFTIFFTPQGTPLTQNILRHLASKLQRKNSQPPLALSESRSDLYRMGAVEDGPASHLRRVVLEATHRNGT